MACWSPTPTIGALAAAGAARATVRSRLRLRRRIITLFIGRDASALYVLPAPAVTDLSPARGIGFCGRDSPPLDHGPEATERAGADLAAQLEPGDVVLVSGELGAGKTTFVRGALRALGVAGSVTSPTFVVGHAYDGAAGPVSHLDLYRLAGMGDEDPGPARPLLRPRRDRLRRVARARARAPGRTSACAHRVHLAHGGGDERRDRGRVILGIDTATPATAVARLGAGRPGGRAPRRPAAGRAAGPRRAPARAGRRGRRATGTRSRGSRSASAPAASPACGSASPPPARSRRRATCRWSASRASPRSPRAPARRRRSVGRHRRAPRRGVRGLAGRVRAGRARARGARRADRARLAGRRRRGGTLSGGARTGRGDRPGGRLPAAPRERARGVPARRRGGAGRPRRPAPGLPPRAGRQAPLSRDRTARRRRRDPALSPTPTSRRSWRSSAAPSRRRGRWPCSCSSCPSRPASAWPPRPTASSSAT